MDVVSVAQVLAAGAALILAVLTAVNLESFPFRAISSFGQNKRTSGDKIQMFAVGRRA